MKRIVLWFLTLCWAYLIFYLTSIPNLKVTENTLLNILIANGSHFFFFGIQAGLLYFTLRNKYAALTLTSLYGVLDELHQRYVPGRAADPMDWLIDTLGAIVFLGILTKLGKKKV